MEWRNINIDGLREYYKVSTTGHVYSLIKNRLLMGSYNSKIYPYKYYFLNGRWYFIHRLVYITFKGEIPEGYEINHIDHNKNNNRLSNLEVVTHEENIRKARLFKQWRGGGRSAGFKHSQASKDKMGRAKYKPVNVYTYSNMRLVKVCVSIEETAQYLNSYRKKVYRALKLGQSVKFQSDTYVLRYA